MKASSTAISSPPIHPDIKEARELSLKKLPPVSLSSSDVAPPQGCHNQSMTTTANVLLLGPAGAGKSTVLKQMRLNYGSYFTKEERQAIVATVHRNVIESMQAIISHAVKLQYTDDVEDQEALALVRDASPDTVLTPELGEAINTVFRDAAIQDAWDRRCETQALDSLEYFVNNITRIASDVYMATTDDWLHTHGATCDTGEQAKYQVQNGSYEWTDLPGVRQKRKAWGPHFANTKAVVYVAALSEYDQVLEEDPDTNRLLEAINLFYDISHAAPLKDATLIVFLNKHDLFVEKLKTKPLQSVPLWQDYKGKGDEKSAVRYFKHRFHQRMGPYRQAYFHVTTATSSVSVKFAFESAADLIMQNAISNTPL